MHPEGFILTVDGCIGAKLFGQGNEAAFRIWKRMKCLHAIIRLGGLFLPWV